jgi:hypothetical protein
VTPALVKQLGNASNKTAGTTLAHTFTGAVAAGNVIVARVLFDNFTTASKPIVSSISKQAGETANWVLLGASRSTSTSAGAFASGEMWAIQTTVPWAAASYTVTLDSSVTMKAVSYAEWTGLTVTPRSTAGSAYSTTTTAASATTTGTTPVVGDLALGFIFGSNVAAAMAGDTDTLGGSWSTPVGLGSTGSSAATNNFGIMVYKVLTAAAHQTLNSSATLTAGNGAIVAILQPLQGGTSAVAWNESATAVGKRSPRATVASTHSWVTAAAGKKLLRGSATVSHAWATTAVGAAVGAPVEPGPSGDPPYVVGVGPRSPDAWPPVLAWPAGYTPTAGDVALISMYRRNGSPNPPAGWSTLGIITGVSCGMAIIGRVLNGVDDTIPASLDSDRAMLTVVRNADLGVIDVAAVNNSGGGNDIVPSSVTTSTDDALLLTFIESDRGDDHISFNAANGFTMLVDSTTYNWDNGGQRIAVALASREDNAPGAQTMATYTSWGAGWSTISLAVRKKVAATKTWSEDFNRPNGDLESGYWKTYGQYGWTPYMQIDNGEAMHSPNHQQTFAIRQDVPYSDDQFIKFGIVDGSKQFQFGLYYINDDIDDSRQGVLVEWQGFGEVYWWVGGNFNGNPNIGTFTGPRTIELRCVGTRVSLLVDDVERGYINIPTFVKTGRAGQGFGHGNSDPRFDNMSGGGIPFTPEGIADCLGWGKVSEPGHITLDGSSKVQDFGKPGMPMVLNQASTGDAPAVTGDILGEPAITFDGTDWLIDWSYGSIPHPHTVGVRVQITNATPVNGIWSRYDGLIMAENSIASGGGGRWAWNSGNPAFLLPGVDTNPHSMMAVFASPNSSQWFDGVKVGSQDTGASASTFPSLGSPDIKPYMKITRWACYNRALTDAEMGKLSLWLDGEGAVLPPTPSTGTAAVTYSSTIAAVGAKPPDPPTGLVITTPIPMWSQPANTVTISASFAVAVGDLIVYGRGGDGNANVHNSTPSNSGTAFTWTERAYDAGFGQNAIWTAVATVAQTMTINHPAVGEKMYGHIWVVKGQHTSPIGVAGANFDFINVRDVSYTATVAGSKTLVIAQDWGEQGPPTSSNMIDVEHGDFSGYTDAVAGIRENAAAGATSFNLDAGGTGVTQLSWAYLEIIPAPAPVGLDSFSDPFERIGPALGAPWTAMASVGGPPFTQPVIVDGHVEASGEDINNAAKVAGNFGTMQWAACTIVLGEDYSEAGVFLQAHDGESQYQFMLTTDGMHPDFPGFGTVDGAAAQLYKGTAGNYVMLANASTGVGGANRLLAVQIGRNLQLWFNGLRWLAATDPVAVIGLDGQPGITIHRGGSDPGWTGYPLLDDFECSGYLTAPSAPTITSIPSTAAPGTAISLEGTGFQRDATMIILNGGTTLPVIVGEGNTVFLPEWLAFGTYSVVVVAPGGTSSAVSLVVEAPPWEGPYLGIYTEAASSAAAPHTFQDIVAPSDVITRGGTLLTVFLATVAATDPGITPPAGLGFAPIGPHDVDSVIQPSTGLYMHSRAFFSTQDLSAETSFRVTFPVGTTYVSRLIAVSINNTSGSPLEPTYSSRAGVGVVDLPYIETPEANSLVLMSAVYDPTADIDTSPGFTSLVPMGTDISYIDFWSYEQRNAGYSPVTSVNTSGTSVGFFLATYGFWPVSTFVPPSVGAAAVTWSEDVAATGKRAPLAASATLWNDALAAVGKRLPKAVTTTLWNVATLAAGKRTPVATATTLWNDALTASGKRAPKATSATTHTWVTAAQGVAPIVGVKQGTAAVSWASNILASGKRAPKATSTTTWNDAITAAGKRVAGGSTSIAWTDVLAGVGKRVPKAVAGATTHLWTLLSSGKRTPKATSTTTHSWVLTAVGVSPTVGVKQGSALVNHTWTAAAVGSRPAKGGVTVVYSFNVLAAGKKITKGVATTAWNVATTAAGKRSPKATVAVAWNVALTAAGYRASRGSTSTAYNWATTANGVKPVVGFKQGFATVTNTWTATAVGKRTPKGSNNVAVTFALTATGKKIQKGTTSLVHTWALSPFGKKVPKGTVVVVYAESINAVGKRVPKSTAAVTYRYTVVVLGISGIAGFVEGIWNDQEVVEMMYGDKSVVEWMLIPS